MSGAPVGSVVSIYYDSPRAITIGDVLYTPTSRMYLIVELRVQARGRHVGRKHLRCMIVDKPPVGCSMFPLFWYARRRRKGLTRAEPQRQSLPV